MPNDTDSIDFNFFETEGDQIKIYKNTSQSYSSKIVTKAVIETNPFPLFELPAEKTKIPKSKDVFVEESNNIKGFDYLSSPTSSLEKKMLENTRPIFDKDLLNCLAYNDTNYKTENHSSFLLDDKESSDSSLSDSTITTVTSDFTSVSPLTCISDSSLTSDEFVETTYFDGKNENGKPCNKDLNNESLNEEEGVNEETRDLDNCNESSWFCSKNGENKIITNTVLDNVNEVMQNKYICADPDVIDNDVFYETVSESENNGISGSNSRVSILEEELGDISLVSQSSSKSNSLKTPLCRGTSKLRIKKKEGNMTFKRDELIKIERDNLILLKKIMAHSKPRSVSLNQSFLHKKASAGINRARQQKKIDQDNYVLFNKISSIGRMKKVF